jgi:hypothetical protein
MADVDHRMADYINRCTIAFQEQVKGGDRWHVKLPESENDAEREALRLFLEMVESEMGMPPARGSA